MAGAKTRQGAPRPPPTTNGAPRAWHCAPSDGGAQKKAKGTIPPPFHPHHRPVFRDFAVSFAAGLARGAKLLLCTFPAAFAWSPLGRRGDAEALYAIGLGRNQQPALVPPAGAGLGIPAETLESIKCRCRPRPSLLAADSASLRPAPALGSARPRPALVHAGRHRAALTRTAKGNRRVVGPEGEIAWHRRPGHKDAPSSASSSSSACWFCPDLPLLPLRCPIACPPRSAAPSPPLLPPPSAPLHLSFHSRPPFLLLSPCATLLPVVVEACQALAEPSAAISRAKKFCPSPTWTPPASKPSLAPTRTRRPTSSSRTMPLRRRRPPRPPARRQAPCCGASGSTAASAWKPPNFSM
jgi:hypothetical protein